MNSGLMLWVNYFVEISICVYIVKCQLTTNVLWDSCDTTICGTNKLNIQCERNSKILVNNVTSGLGHEFDEISYKNLRRMCMGMSSCDPNQTGFCGLHNQAVRFNVSYTCVKDRYIDNTCDKDGIVLSNKSGFITNPNYPAQTNNRNCKWKIVVPESYYVHVFLHEVVLNHPTQCSESEKGGLRFSTINNCENRFPTFPVCSESSMDVTITACSNTEIWLPLSDQDMRFWLSYYVVEVPELRHVSLYNVDITCNVHAKDKFTYHIQEQTDRTYSVNTTENSNIVVNNGTATIDRSTETDEEEVEYVMYIGLAVGVLVIIVIIIIAVIYLRGRYLSAKENKDTKSNLSNSNSLTNCSEIQKRPLPDTQSNTDLDDKDTPVLQQSYSIVADEIPRQTAQTNLTSPTYAEIEEYSDSGIKPKLPLVNKRSIDNSKRKLPAKPDEPQSSIYSEIEDADEKDAGSEKEVISKNKKNQEKIYPAYLYKKKLSNASNIYDECQDVSKMDSDKTYIDMSHKKKDESEYVPHCKISKDMVNQSKKDRVTDKWTNQNIIYADCDEKTNGSGKESRNKLKKESVTSESDSDEDICIVENELYEPFESAKV
ncbi:uncharacterized protein LOC123531794 isoform X3 [Mercenaria mercenaria]|uniref:uncharacterized protein LOC123531794 isoform X3 n=1 Tax=Mercenaria mercenaria TaxID=6596 RepID=UPI00234F380C|nr:uncharacterized protein LOC123531794 isoform X3 [Mercenaria mercenaria]